MSTAKRIASATSENARLLAILSHTEHAEVSLSQHEKYVSNLRTEITAAEDHLQRLVVTLQNEQKDHEKYSDSTMRRLAYRLGGRSEQFAAKAAKEEREYLAAKHEEWRFRETRDGLSKRLESAEAEKIALQKAKKEHLEAQRELEGLYDEIFNGPTPEYPEEDAVEQPFRTVKADYDAVQGKIQGSRQAVTSLTEAVKEMEIVIKEIESATKGLKADLRSLGNSFAEMPQRDTLNRARVHASLCNTALQSARQCDPEVPSLPVPAIAAGTLLSDVVFDALLTDSAFTEKIIASAKECREALQRYEDALDDCRSRKAKFWREGDERKKAVDEARLALLNVRMTVMQKAMSPVIA